MTTLHTPVELPTGRHSFAEFPMTANIQDPSCWDALSNDEGPTRHNSKLTITTSHDGQPLPKSSSRNLPRSQRSIRLQPSPALEFPPQELEAQPVAYFPPRQSSAQGAWTERVEKNSNVQETHSDAGHVTQSSDDYTGSASSASTTGTSSLQENQVYSLPTSAVSKDETIASPIIQSSRSATNSVKKASLPTSKYKKKPPTLKSSARRKSEAEAPPDSPVSSYTQIGPSPALVQGSTSSPSELPAAVTPLNFPLPPPPPPPSEAHAATGQAPLQHAKSTASVRKARALHSHPSIPTMRTDLATSSPVSQLLPSPSNTQRNRKSVDTIRSRPSIYELQEPSPAPTTPLPELPVGAQPLSRPASQAHFSHPTPPPDVYVRPGTSGSTIAPTLRRQETTPQLHTEMANFMANNSKIIFRRFHDVHIRLLLTLQDEISALENELAEIENMDIAINADRETRRIKVLSELRRLMAEYDHLFTNWNLMQASKADTKTREELEQYLKQSETGPNAMTSSDAAEDLQWVQTHSNDLSYVDLNVKKAKVTVAQNEVLSEKRESSVHARTEPGLPPLPKSSSSGGFAALFASCTGRRK